MGSFAYSTGDPHNGAHVLTVSGIETVMTSMFGMGEDLNTGLHGIAVNWTLNSSFTSTAEKLNTLSPAPSSTYLADSSPANARITMSLVAFSHSAWRGNPLRPLLAADGEGHHIDPAVGFPGGSTGTKTALFAESRQVPFRSPHLTRRSRMGCLFILGNDIGHHQKAGSGAFSMRVPHFDNDILWVDPSAWRNGMAQSEVWSMQLFGAPPAPEPQGFPILFAGD